MRHIRGNKCRATFAILNEIKIKKKLNITGAYLVAKFNYILR